MIYGFRRMIHLLRKHDIISVPSYAAGVYHPPQVDIISKIYHPFRQERISLKNDKFPSKLVVFHGGAGGILLSRTQQSPGLLLPRLRGLRPLALGVRFESHQRLTRLGILPRRVFTVGAGLVCNKRVRAFAERPYGRCPIWIVR